MRYFRKTRRRDDNTWKAYFLYTWKKDAALLHTTVSYITRIEKQKTKPSELVSVATKKIPLDLFLSFPTLQSFLIRVSFYYRIANKQRWSNNSDACARVYSRVSAHVAMVAAAAAAGGVIYANGMKERMQRSRASLHSPKLTGYKREIRARHVSAYMYIYVGKRAHGLYRAYIVEMVKWNWNEDAEKKMHVRMGNERWLSER